MHFNRTVRNFVVESSCDVNEAFKWELSYVITARPSTSATAKKSCLTSTESLLSSTRPLLDLPSSGDQHEAVDGSSVVWRPALGRCWIFCRPETSTRPLMDLPSSGYQHEAAVGFSVAWISARGRSWIFYRPETSTRPLLVSGRQTITAVSCSSSPDPPPRSGDSAT